MTVKRAKVTVVGAGFVGAGCAQRILEKQLADVVLLDVVEGLPQGKALDMMESASLEGFDAAIVGTNSYLDTKNSDVIVVTAGLARKPGMSRDDLLARNAEIVGDVVSQTAFYSPGAILIVVTNPLDVMSQLAWEKSGFEHKRVIGMGGVLDSARYAYFIAAELGVSPKDVRAMVLGGHGDAMVPVSEFSTVNGVPLVQLLSAERMEAIEKRTRAGGIEIVNLLKTASASYAPSASAVAMVEAILKDSGRLLPCAAYLEGQYGISGTYCGVPVILDSSGVRRVVEFELRSADLDALRKSAAAVRESINQLK